MAANVTLKSPGNFDFKHPDTWLKWKRRFQQYLTATQYITCLYSLIETCEYGTFKEELLRDRLIVGIRDVALSGKLQIDADLTLEKAKKAIRQKEAVHEQQRQLQGDGSAKDPAVVEERQVVWSKGHGRSLQPTTSGGRN